MFQTNTARRATHRAAALLALGAVALTACARDSGPQSLPTAPSTSGAPSTSAPTATSATVAPTTTPETVAPAPATSVPPTSAPVTAPATTAPPATTVAPTPTTTTTTVAPEPAPEPTDVSLSMWIAGVEEGDPEVTSDGVNCLGFYEAQGASSYSACGEWNAAGGRRIWAVTKGATDRFFAVVWQETAPFNWVPRLRVLEPAPGTWSAVTMISADIDGGPNEELVAGIRFEGTGGYLDIDVIDVIGGNPKVVGHVDGLSKGIAYTESKTGVRLWGAEFGPEDAGCCPSSYSHNLLKSGAGGWVLDEGPPVDSPEDIPFPSQF